MQISASRMGAMLPLVAALSCTGLVDDPPQRSTGDLPPTAVDEGEGDEPGQSDVPPGVPVPTQDPREEPPIYAGDSEDPAFLDQDRLFTCIPEETTFTPQRVWRLSAAQFIRSGNHFAGTSQTRTPDPFGFTPSGKTFNNYAQLFSIAESQLDGVFRSGRTAALRALRDNKLPGCLRNADRRAQEDGEPIDPTGPGWFDEACQRALIAYGFTRLVRRPAQEEEIATLQPQMHALTQTLGVHRGMVASMTLLFGHPDFLFRSERGTVEPGGGRARLTAYELGAALTFALQNRSPSEARILAEIEQGTIVEPDVRRETIRRLFDTDQRSSAFLSVMTTFIREYFHHDAGAQIQKDGRPGYRWSELAQSRDRFIERMIRQDEQFLSRLLSSTDVVDQEGVVSADPQRPGLLTRGAWLVSYSQNDHTDPIRRGHFIREQLLCQGIPEIPIGVIAQLPDATSDTTMRDRLAMHRSDESCAACHDLMDPLGLPFEQFDHYGDFRTQEAGRPVDTTGEILHARDLAGRVEGPGALVARLAGAEEVERCFVRHLFRYFMGRDETYGDACTLRAAHEAYRTHGGSLKAAVESLMMSDTVLYRAVIEER